MIEDHYDDIHDYLIDPDDDDFLDREPGPSLESLIDAQIEDSINCSRCGSRWDVCET
jgi:hypothetical protein